MKDLKGKKIGLSKSLNIIKNDWWRVQEEQGIELMLMLNDMTRDDVEIVEFPYPDDWYDNPAMLTPMENPSELWLKRDHKHDLAFRPLETALLKGRRRCDLYPKQGFPACPGADGQDQGHREPGQLPGLDPAGANVPATSVSEVACEEHPELIVTLLKGLIKVGRWANEHKHAAAAILNKQTYLPGCRGYLPGIQDVDMVPSLSPTTWKRCRSTRTSC